MKIQQKPDPLVRQPKVGEQLRVMDRRKPLDSLDFDDYGVFDDQIEPISAVQFHILVGDRQRHLHFH